MKEVWNTTDRFWDLKLGRNLKDEEATEWAGLGIHLAPIILSQAEDTWKWPLNHSGNFSTKSLISDMGDSTRLLETSLTRGIWKDNYPKKIKIFLWELSHKAILTQKCPSKTYVVHGYFPWVVLLLQG